ncbi:DUF4116 domain-containing protein [Butyricimonas sp.]|uniref:DUF4116 domain-containing protein n=1 Tax=Butyricimonas sp. TaxID=1969738 RepID=UPI0025C3ADE2|nr:DUF4116 domain-containing protein [Butyricimonas sp.]
MEESNGFQEKHDKTFSEVYMRVLKEVGQEIGTLNVMEKFLPEYVTSEIAKEAINQDVRCIALVPSGIELPGITDLERVDIKAVVRDGNGTGVFDKLPPERQTELVSLVAVSVDPNNLYVVPGANRSERVIEAALKQDGSVIAALDSGEIADAWQILAIRHMNYDYPETLAQCPRRLLDEDLCLEAVTNCPHALQHVPEEMRTVQICEAAAKNLSIFDDDACELLPLIPSNIIAKNIDSWKYQDVSTILHYIKPEHITPDVVNWVTRFDEEAFKQIPEKMKTPAACLFQEKYHPLFFLLNPDQLPKSVREGNNVYTLNKRVESEANEKFTHEQICNLFVGTRLNGIRKAFDYNPERGTLKVIDLTRLEDKSRGLKFR